MKVPEKYLLECVISYPMIKLPQMTRKMILCNSSANGWCI